jgi:superfamily II DNA or RNA helicase
MSKLVLVTPRYVCLEKNGDLNKRIDCLKNYQYTSYVPPWAAKNKGIKPTTSPLYRVTTGRVDGQVRTYIQFPRFCLERLLIDFPHVSAPVYRSLYAPTAPNLVLGPSFTPTELQKQVVTLIGKTFCDETAQLHQRLSLIIAMDTGVGKTYVAANVMGRLKLRTIFITLNHVLVRQAIDVFTECFPTAIIADHVDTSVDVAVVNIDQALTFKPQIFDGFGFTIFDEAPALCTPTRREIFWCKSKYSLALTAEPESRVDGQHIYMHRHLGAVIDEYMYDPPTDKFTVNFTVTPFPVKHSAARAPTFLGESYNEFVANSSYNNMVVELSKLLLERNLKHFIFTHHVDHVIILTNLLRESGMSNVYSLTSGATNSHDLDESNVIVSTYSMGTVGISVVTMHAMILAEPPYQTSYKQLFGRIKRISSNLLANSITREVHIFDTNNSMFIPHLAKLKKYFRHNHEQAPAHMMIDYAE